MTKYKVMKGYVKE